MVKGVQARLRSLAANWTLALWAHVAVALWALDALRRDAGSLDPAQGPQRQFANCSSKTAATRPGAVHGLWLAGIDAISVWNLLTSLKHVHGISTEGRIREGAKRWAQ